MNHKDYCSRCDATDKPLIKYARPKNTQYYLCNECNTARRKRYFETPEGKAAHERARINTEIRHPYHQKARRQVYTAVKAGRLQKPETCSICPARKNIQGHHPDYSEPLSVVWLCVKCHSNLHNASAYERNRLKLTQTSPLYITESELSPQPQCRSYK